MCLYPTLRKNKKYMANKKNGGKVPPLPYIKTKEGKLIQDERVLYVPTKCGKCMECMKAKSREWQIRMSEEIKDNKNGIFVTLTFSDEKIKELGEEINKIKIITGVKVTKDKNGKERKRYIYEESTRTKEIQGYDRDNEIAKLGVKRFLERWRKATGKSIRHWLVTELGHQGTENIHLHGIIFTDESDELIKEKWQDFVWIGERGKRYVSDRTINYITKYINKVDQIHKNYKPEILTSAGMGAGYIKRINAQGNKYKKNGKTNEAYRNDKGYKMSLPIYLRNKIYNEEEREKLWQEKLDKEKRYVGGEEIDISKGEENYTETVEYYRKINNRLGYGSNKINWDRRKYEHERRNINYITRTKKKE